MSQEQSWYSLLCKSSQVSSPASRCVGRSGAFRWVYCTLRW